MIRIAICDDEKHMADHIKEMVSDFFHKKNREISIRTFLSGEDLLSHDGQIDILFLDIEMEPEGMNGIELAAKLRKNDSSIQLVFVTGYMEYIADGYDVEALHYLLKPVTEEKLGSVLARALERVKAREKELFLQTTDGSVRVLNSEIRYLEVQRNYVTIHAAEEYTVKRTLGDLEKELDESFFRTGRSFIVNLRFVRKITKTQVFLKDGAQVPLSRGLYEGINRAMIQYF